MARRSGAEEAFERIRDAILRAELPPGSRISQVRLAEDLGLSRTPVREALRRIEQEGLVESATGRMVRIAPASAEDLDRLYALRIGLECSAARIAVGALPEEDLATMRQCLAAMTRCETLERLADFESAHRSFHQAVIAPLGSRAVRLAAQLSLHAERYRRIYLARPASWGAARQDHAAILAACEARDGAGVATLLGQHYGRVAESVIGQIDAACEPRWVRAALREATRGTELAA